MNLLSFMGILPVADSDFSIRLAYEHWNPDPPRSAFFASPINAIFTAHPIIHFHALQLALVQPPADSGKKRANIFLDKAILWFGLSLWVNPWLPHSEQFGSQRDNICKPEWDLTTWASLALMQEKPYSCVHEGRMPTNDKRFIIWWISEQLGRHHSR